MTNAEILDLFRARRDDWPDHVALVSVAREIERKARASEREACARACDAIERQKWLRVWGGGKVGGFSPADCARAIRARSK
jgi:hypothetical protein